MTSRFSPPPRAGKVQRANEQRVARIYGERCKNIQIPMMEIGNIAKVGHAAIAEGKDDIGVGDAIRAYVDKIAVAQR